MSYLVKALARLDLKSHWRYIARDNLATANRLWTTWRRQL
jgi:plasmid stabilization system protein ParE